MWGFRPGYPRGRVALSIVRGVDRSNGTTPSCRWQGAVRSARDNDRGILIRGGRPDPVILPPTATRLPGMQHSANTPAPPANSPNHHNVSRSLLSQTTAPYLSPPTSGFSVQQYLGATRKRLLVPTVRRSGDGCSPKPASRPVSKLMRSTSGSTSHHSSPDPGAAPRQVTWAGKEWIGVDCKFEVVEELELEGYQIYAVEKWCVVLWSHPAPKVNNFSRVVERIRPITVLTVYTGDPKHKVRSTNVTPSVALFMTPERLQ